MGGWFSPEIIKRCLNSFSAVELIEPEIYFYEPKSINSNEIEKIVTTNPNVKGYIRFKENFLSGVDLLAFDHFKDNFNDNEYMAHSAADIIIYSTSIVNQIKILEKVENAGLICQKNSHLGRSQKDFIEMEKWYMTGVYPSIPQVHGQGELGPRGEKERHEDYDRAISNGGLVMIAEKEDFVSFRNSVFHRDILMATMEPFMFKDQYRPPIWIDLDLCRYFEIVLNKQSLTYTKEKCYELTLEEYNDPHSEYLKNKLSVNYIGTFRRYANDPGFANYSHDKCYEDGTLKYDIII